MVRTDLTVMLSQQKGVVMGLKKLLPALAMTTALMVGTAQNVQATCETPGTHWHWRSATDKFRSEKRWTNCTWNTTTRQGTCTSWYNAYNYFYYCSPDVGMCYWRYTGKVTDHHTHKCIYYVR